MQNAGNPIRNAQRVLEILDADHAKDPPILGRWFLVELRDAARSAMASIDTWIAIKPSIGVRRPGNVDVGVLCDRIERLLISGAAINVLREGLDSRVEMLARECENRKDALRRTRHIELWNEFPSAK